MKKTYQIVEPVVLSELLGEPRAFEVTIALLSWLVDLTNKELKDQLQGAEVEVIRAEYHGPYPAIGVCYESATASDLGPLVEATIARMLRDRAAQDFVDFLGRVTTDWRREAERLVGPKSAH